MYVTSAQEDEKDVVAERDTRSGEWTVWSVVCETDAGHAGCRCCLFHTVHTFELPSLASCCWCSSSSLLESRSARERHQQCNTDALPHCQRQRHCQRRAHTAQLLLV